MFLQHKIKFEMYCTVFFVSLLEQLVNFFKRKITIKYKVGLGHKVLTCIEYRAVSGVDTPHPFSPQRVCPPPPPSTKHTRRAVRGWGVNISEMPDIGWASYSIIPLRIGANKERRRDVEKVSRRARERGKDERKRDVLVSRYIYT